MDEFLENEKIRMTPDNGFNLVAMDYFAADGKQLYLIEHFDMYKDALDSKKARENQEGCFILYKGSSGEFLSR